MVRPVTSFARSGLSDWLIQRVSAIVMTTYFLFMVYWLTAHKDFDYSAWQSLHHCIGMKIFNTITLLSVVAHAWIGMWAVLTDYLTERLLGKKALPLRLLCQVGINGLLVVYTLWGLAIVWGV